jgi:hypothetical protein
MMRMGGKIVPLPLWEAAGGRGAFLRRPKRLAPLPPALSLQGGGSQELRYVG